MTAANAATPACGESQRQPSAICTNLGIPSAFPLFHLLSVPFPLRKRSIVKITRK
ncbi:hypothetical protein EVA_17374 [gut metagenome]|uniref:Uncharacterized protein n=1 Tax=gut metagenome TaxID=749906 RepID=J9FJD5_9ZZZZ